MGYPILNSKHQIDMTLSYKTEIKRRPTHFPEKIIKGLSVSGRIKETEVLDLYFKYLKQSGQNTDCAYEEIKPKYHTIREDNSNRWRGFKIIHHVVGNRTKNRFQFAPTMPMVSVQRIFMTYDHSDIIEISVDGSELLPSERNELAINDGFDSWTDFFNWFYPIIEASEDKAFSGKIIHWTDLRY
jgi:hypothetical protein